MLDKNQLENELKSLLKQGKNLDQAQEQGIDNIAESIAQAVHDYTKQGEVEVDHSNTGAQTYTLK
jgi:hypothetical protein